MKHINICKYLALICLALSILITLCACNPTGNETNGTTASNQNDTTAPDADETTTPAEDETDAPSAAKAYKITVLDPNGAPFVGAFITCADDASIMAITDATGTAPVTAKEAYTLNIAAGSYGNVTVTLASDTNVTVNLTLADDGKVEYTVKVMDENGKGIEDVKVQLCVGDLCQLPVHTDASGVAVVRAEEDHYTVKITKDGYISEDAYMFSMGSHELKVILKTAE